MLVSKKEKTIGLNLDLIDQDILSSIAEKIEKEVKSFIEKQVPPKTDYDVIILLENDGKRINFSIDIILNGEFTGIIDYDAIVGDAVNVARKILEQELQKYRKTS